MGTILEYVKNYDEKLEARPFNDVDNLLLCELAYLELDGIVPCVGEQEYITLESAAKLFFESGGRSQGLGTGVEALFAAAARSERYKNARLYNYKEILDENSGADFCALHFDFGGLVYVAFRGTSDSLVGWREDFSMSFRLMPSQKIAADYLNGTLRGNKNYIVGGHSKGGNLALYSSMTLTPQKQKLVKRVYSNDGPGLCTDIIDTRRYCTIAEKLVRIVPEFSIIGALFEAEKPTKIVKSSASGFAQHDCGTWIVSGDKLCTAARRSEEARYLNEIFDKWIKSATPQQKMSFTDDFFDVLEEINIQSGSGYDSGFDKFEAVLLSLIKSKKKSKQTVGKLLGSFFSTVGSVHFFKTFRRQKLLQGILLFAVGAFFAAVPQAAVRCVGAGVGVVIIIRLAIKQLDIAFSGKDALPNAKGKMIINMILMCAVVFLIAQKSLLLNCANLFMGGVLLYFAFNRLKCVVSVKQPRRSSIKNTAVAAAAFVMGVVPVLTANAALWQYAFSLGILVMLCGVGKICIVMYEKYKKPAKPGGEHFRKF